MKTLKTVLPSLGFLLWVTLCTRPSHSNELIIRMCDAPAPLNAVNVEIKTVKVHYSSEGVGKQGWVTLETNAGVYDLLHLQGNLTAVLSYNSALPDGVIDEVDIELGTHHSVVADHHIFPMQAGESQPGQRNRVAIRVEHGQRTDVLLDFDAAHSVMQVDDAHYLLIPVISVKEVQCCSI